MDSLKEKAQTRNEVNSVSPFVRWLLADDSPAQLRETGLLIMAPEKKTICHSSGCDQRGCSPKSRL